MKFGEAFAAARKAGKKEFEWEGKKYHTRTKEEDAKAKSDTLSEAKVTAKRVPVAPKTSGDSAGDRYARSASAGTVPGRSGSAGRNTKPKAEPKAKPKAETKEVKPSTVAERYSRSARAGTLPGKSGSASRNVPKKPVSRASRRKRSTR